MKATWMSVVVLLGLAACGDGQSITRDPVDASAPSPPTDGASTTDATAPSPATTLTLHYDGKSALVDLATLPMRDYKGSQVVTLSDAWEKAALAPRSAIAVDFEGDDGFRPSSRDRCKNLLSGATLDRAYVVPATRTLVWDDALGLPGCYSVKYVRDVFATDEGLADAGAGGG